VFCAIAASPARPAEHELQAATPAALYWPSGQPLQDVDSTKLVLKLPAPQSSHCDEDTLSANLPPSHCSQSAALAPLYLPAGHDSHDPEPATG
jgi:hypothetical protein